MNEIDRDRLATICSVSEKDSVVVFDELEAQIILKAFSLKVFLSEPVSSSKVAISADTLKSIISTLPSGDIDVSEKLPMKITFSSKSSKRTVSMIDADAATFPDYSNFVEELTITNPEEFSKAINFTLPFIHKDIQHPTGCVFLKFYEKNADIIGFDGPSCAFKRYMQILPFDDCNMTLTAEQCNILTKVFANEESKIAKIAIDSSGKTIIKTQIGVAVLPRFNQEFKDIGKMIDTYCAMNTEGVMASGVETAELGVVELRKALSHVISMFARDEFPYVDLFLSKKGLKVEAEVSVRGYDCFRAGIESVCTGEYTVQVSPVIFAKCIQKFSGKITIMWKSGSDPTTSPITISQNGREIVFFSPKMKEPRGSYADQ